MSAHGGHQQNGSTEADFVRQFDEIQKLLECPESKTIFNNVKGEDITIFIGNTRSGKSTLVNFAIGNALKAVQMDVMPFALTLVKVNDREPGPIIGLESVSETTLPSVWSAAKSGLSGKVVDAPGFEDNRGEAQDIANTFYIKEIIRNAKSVKFVLITDINDIMSQNISNFTNFIDKMHRIFPKTEVLQGGIALIFSKQTGPFTVDNICKFFEKSILNQQRMKVEKSLIRYFKDHKECIAFFKMPPSEGPVSASDIDGGIIDIIKSKIRGINGAALSDVKPGISDKSKVFLLQTYADFCNGVEYVELLQKIKDVLVKKCMEMSSARSSEESIQIYEAILGLENKILELFPRGGTGLNFNNVLEKLASLCSICGITNLMDSSNIAVHIQFVVFLDQILNLQNGEIYVAKLQGTIQIIKNQFEMSRIIHATAMKQISDMEAERLRREQSEKHSTEMKYLIDKMVQQQKDNERNATEQSRKLGFFGKCARFGKNVFHATGEFLGGALESAGETLDNTKDWFTSFIP